ncbi:S35B4 protein, partial [Todus mexicanus]|nr:S35B4 protein [Todus mexicanus]
RRYSVSKYTSIALVSLGIFTCTFMSAKQVASDSSLNKEDGLQVFLWWLLGIAALTFALLMSARMGIFQETLYKQFGKHSKEALFYNVSHHVFSVVFYWADGTAGLWCPPSSPAVFPYLRPPRYVCIRGVFILTTECTSLTVTLVVTLRKFVSLIFSILYFRNPFTAWHWLGTAFVFVGTLMYTEVWNSLGPFLARWRKRPKAE